MYRTNRHSCYDLEYHLVVVTKYRHPVIINDLKDRLIELSYNIIEKDFKCYINAINTDKDHIHILFEAPPQVQLSRLVNNYKTVTSRMIRKEFSIMLRPYYWENKFWSSSYFIGTVSEKTHNTIKRYITLQDKSD